MTRDERSGGHRAHRHLLTSARDGSLGAPGFQTVAAAGTLGPELIEQLERDVGFYALPAGDLGHPALQLRRWDENFHLLTRYLPAGEGADGRRGNYLAESLLVPTAWLAAAEWDVAAAFAAVVWWGAERLESLGADARSLPDEPLPDLAPGPLDRLSGLAEHAPGELLDHLLLAAVGWAVRGERLAVVEADPERPEALAAVVSLLPLALPPACRAGRRNGRLRGIELRTRGPAQGMPQVDLAGVAAADLDRAEGAGRTVIDLGGRLPLEDRPDLDGYDYAQWAGAALRAGRWEEMAEVYARAGETPPEELFRRFATLRREWREEGSGGAAGAPAAGAAAPRRPAKRTRPVATPAPTVAAVDLPGDTLPALDEERRERWQGRRDLEAAAARGHDARRAEMAALVAAVEDENRRALEEIREQLDAAGERLLERLRGEREALWEETARALDAAAIEAQKRLHRDVERSLAQLRDEGDEMLRRMRRDTGHRERRLATGAATATAGGGWGAFWRDADGGSWRRPAAIAAGVLIAALLAWGAWRLWGPAAEQGGGDPGVVAAGAPSAGADDLVGRLRDGPVAGRLLLRARERQDLVQPAATTALALFLGDAPPPAAAERCLLLQAALHRRGLGPAGRPLAVDGDCGPATWGTVAEATSGSCCGEIPLPAGGALPEERAACFLATTFGLPEAERCAGGDPFAEREWTSGEAANALALVRAVGETAAAPVRAAAERFAAAHDLGASPAIVERVAALPVSAAEAGLLLDLARALATGPADDPAGDDEVVTLLDALAAPDAATAGAPATATGGREAP